LKGNLCGNVAAGTRAIVDYDRLTYSLGELFSHDPSSNVGRATWREWNNHADSTLRICGRFRIRLSNSGSQRSEHKGRDGNYGLRTNVFFRAA
jgi:hypothetical protein